MKLALSIVRLSLMLMLFVSCSTQHLQRSASTEGVFLPHTSMGHQRETSPIKGVYNDRWHGPVLDCGKPSLNVIVQLAKPLSARPQSSVEIHFLERGKTEDNEANDPTGLYHIYYDMSQLCRIITMINSPKTVFYCDSVDVKQSGFAECK